MKCARGFSDIFIIIEPIEKLQYHLNHFLSIRMCMEHEDILKWILTNLMRGDKVASLLLLITYFFTVISISANKKNKFKKRMEFIGFTMEDKESVTLNLLNQFFNDKLCPSIPFKTIDYFIGANKSIVICTICKHIDFENSEKGSLIQNLPKVLVVPINKISW